MSALPAHIDLQPVKAGLVADLVDLINLDLSKVVKASAVACPTCKGVGVVGDRESGNDTTCAGCQGVGVVEAFVLDMEAIQTPRIGRHVEQWEYKQGQLVPKFRGKTSAFSQLTKILGLDKAVVELANAASFVDSITPETRAQYLEQLKELAAMGALDGTPDGAP